MRGRVAFQFVGHQPTGTTTLPFHQLIEEPYRSLGITPLLDECVDDVAVLVYGAIEIVLLLANANEHLVYMPGISVATIPPTQAPCVCGPEFLTTPPDRLI